MIYIIEHRNPKKLNMTDCVITSKTKIYPNLASVYHSIAGGKIPYTLFTCVLGLELTPVGFVVIDSIPLFPLIEALNSLTEGVL